MEEDAAIVKRLDFCFNTARYPHARESSLAYKWIDSIDDIQHEMFLRILSALAPKLRELIARDLELTYLLTHISLARYTTIDCLLTLLFACR